MQANKPPIKKGVSTDITQKFIPLASNSFPIKIPEFVAQYKNRMDNNYCTIPVITTFLPLQRRIKDFLRQELNAEGGLLSDTKWTVVKQHDAK